MRAFFILLFIFSTSLALAQNLDSLKAKVEVTPEAEKFETILSYMRVLLQSDVKASYTISEYAVQFAASRGDSLLLSKALFAQGFLLRRMSRENEAIAILLNAYGMAKRNNYLLELSRITNLLAISYTYTGSYDEALQMNFEALTVNEKRNDIEDMSISYNNIGIVYFKLHNNEEALKYYEYSLEAKKKSSSLFDLDRLYVNMALALNNLKRYEQAEARIEDALKVCETNCSDEIIMEAAFGLGVSLFQQGEIREAEEQLTKALAIAKKLKDNRFEIETLNTLAELYLNEGRMEEALHTLQVTEMAAKATDYRQALTLVYNKFSDYYSKTNDFKNAAFYSKRYSELRDSVLSEKLINNLATVQAKYAERENLSTIADNQKVIRAQRNLNYAIAFIVVMAFAFIYLIMRNSRTIRSLNTRLAQEVQQKTMELVKSNHSLKQVNEELDNLVYKTSHDIRGPLATLKGVCNIALMDVKDDTALAFLKKLDSTSSQLNLVLDKFSRVNEIYNTVIRPQRLGIQAVIEEMVSVQQKIPRQKRIAVIQEIQTIEDFQTSPSLFYYALNSLIDNAFRYYNESPRVDSFVKISVERKRDDVVIRIIDNGVGIPVNIDSDSLFHMFTRGSERSLTGGMGLFIASTAVRKLQGEIKFQRSPDFILTEFIMILPLKMDFSRIEHPKERGKILPATTELIATLDSRFEK